MDKIEEIKAESERLYKDIDNCIAELINARTNKDTDAEGKALFRMEGLMVGTLQHLACIIEPSENIGPSEDLEEGKAMLYVADKSYHIGWRDCKKRIIGIIEKRMSEILGDAQPAPVLRMELDDIIKRINEDEK